MALLSIQPVKSPALEDMVQGEDMYSQSSRVAASELPRYHDVSVTDDVSHK